MKKKKKECEHFSRCGCLNGSVVVFPTSTSWLSTSLMVSNCWWFLMYVFGGRLTGQGWSHRSPLHPAVHVQEPSAGWHWALLAHWHEALQPGPHVPSEHGMEQSGPLHPVKNTHAHTHVNRQWPNGFSETKSKSANCINCDFVSYVWLLTAVD